MTRKRFIKLLMSSGTSRNEAAKLAAFADERRSYEKLYADLDMAPCTLNKQMQQLKDAFEGMATVISHMKLIFAVVNGDDSAAVSKSLSKHGFPATKLASSGSFLSAGNTTFLICVSEDQVDDVIDVVQQKCHHRKQFIPSTATMGTNTTTAAPPSMPLEVSVGGATIFVTDIERFEKL